MEEGEFLGTDRFAVLRRLGAGGMGVVYEAVDRERGARVALKTLKTLSPDAILRFKAEFRGLQDLHHPNLVGLGELFEADERWFFTMEMVEGLHFLEYVRGDVDRLRAALAQLALGLAALHRAGKVHRDIKPSNILVTATGRVVILDFGLVTDLAGAVNESHLVGTISYMAPEQAALQAQGPAADWYSVGVLLFQALTGRLPLEGPPQVLLMKKQSVPAPAPSTIARVPEDLDRLAVALLRREPWARPGEREILKALQVTGDAGRTAHARFVGRRAELEVLAEAMAARAGGAVTLLVDGESGVGKTALTRRFVKRAGLADPNAVILTGRCYERESVPFKAVDDVIDALSRHLDGLAADELAAVLPDGAGLLGQVFPVLARVAALAGAARPASAGSDPQARRARLFAALRELFVRLAGRAPLVLMIDDLQWADADSLALLADVVRPPGEPRMLLIATLRAAFAGAEARSVEQIAAQFPGDVRRLTVEALPPADAQALCAALLCDVGAAEGSSEALAHEAGGHPLFIDELVRLRLAPGEPAGAVRLEDALRRRVAELEAPARRLLELLAVVGAPVEQDTAARAAQAEYPEFVRQVALLRAHRLVRTGGARLADSIEPYHDRIRHAVLLGLDAPALAACHGRLARALEASARADAEALAVHWRGAGEPLRAARFAAQAADEAAAALAFDRAARLYQLALELTADPAREAGAPIGRGDLHARLGDALANAGRGADAARAYLAAAEGRPAAEALGLRRRAADQLLRSGHIDAAMETFRAVLATVGMAMPQTPRRALAALALRRAQVRLRGLKFRERDEAEVDPADLLVIDACWSVASGLGLVDTIVGSYFQARGLVLALDAGEPGRIARALAIEAGYSSASGGASRRRTAALIEAAQALAGRLGQPYALAWASAAEGIAAALEGRWRTAHLACERAERMFAERCTGVVWELATMQWFSHWALANLGELGELGRRIPERLREARERGDLYAAICHSTGLANLVWLAADAPAEARERAREATLAWSQRKFHVEYWWAMLSDGQIDLYLGDAEAAHRNIVAPWPALDRSMLLLVQLTRIEALQLRARAALMLARQQPARRQALRREAARDAAALARQGTALALPWAALLRAGVAALAGDDAGALRLLAEAARGFDAADMALYAAATRRRQGQLLGGDAGAALCAAADAFMTGQGIVDPARMGAMLAPGFPV